jgi:hypothetical protein
MGVMSSFSVAKKITEEDISKYFSKHKRAGKSEKQIGEMLRAQIVSDISKAVEKNQIPGIISVDELPENLGIDKEVVENMPELNRLIIIITNKMAEKKYDKMSLCYFINSIVNMLGLSEEDFNKFHRKNGPVDAEEPDDEDYNDEEPDDEDDDGPEFGKT